MSDLLIKHITISDPGSSLHGKSGHLEIHEGQILHFHSESPNAHFDNEIDGSGCIATPSFIDLRCHSPEPGYEHTDTFQSLSDTAIRGGFSHIALLPDSFPVRQSASDIEFVNNRTSKLPVHFMPLGAITKDLNSHEMTEMYDMQQVGAIAFSNAENTIDNIGVMSRAMLYARNFKGFLYSICQDKSLSGSAYVSEGSVAVSLGLKGIPVISESILVQRDIELAEYHQTRLHISKISTAKSVELIRQAKAQGIQITCDVAVMNLVLTDEAIMDFDSQLKLSPPLRQASDVKALWEGLADGTIDAICTDHYPREIEKKNVEFEYASYGSISMQIALNLAVEGRNRFFKEMDDDSLFQLLNSRPAEVLSIQNHHIETGTEAKLCIVDPSGQTKLSSKNNQSLSANSYYMNKPLPYSIQATIIGKNSLYNNQQHS